MNKVIIEGKLQDIELVMNDGEITYAQYDDYKKLIYVSNSIFSLGKKRSFQLFSFMKIKKKDI